jgi:hypothetical protein
MNRRDRRKARHQQPVPAQVWQTAECPDCNAAVIIAQIGPGHFVANVIHDDTCPRHNRWRKHAGFKDGEPGVRRRVVELDTPTKGTPA